MASTVQKQIVLKLIFCAMKRMKRESLK